MPTEPPFQALIFDVGGVIVPHDNEMLYARLAGRCTHPDALARIRGQSGHTGVGSGAISVQELHRRMADDVGYQGDWATFAEDWSCHLGLDLDMLDLVERLAQANRVALFSNTTDVHWARVDALSGGRINRIEQYLSHLIGLEKPALEAYRLVAERGGFDPGRCLFIDDMEPNVLAARRAGFQAEQFTGQAALETLLANRGVRWTRQTQETV
jgi:putative hydrolase of the HAD superfamily